MKSVLPLVVFLFACSCQKELPQPELSKAFVEIKNPIKSPLDSILGEKMLDWETNEIRPDNFQKFIGLSKGSLTMKSDLYTVTPIDENHYLLKQNKSYSHARHFNAILKLEDERVTDYFISNDFSIKDVKRAETGWMVLSTDFDNHNHFWRSGAGITVQKLDDHLDTLWTYKADPRDPALEAWGIVEEEGQLFYSIAVMTGSHLLNNGVYLELDDKGKFKSVKEVSQYESEPLDPYYLDMLFNPDMELEAAPGGF